MTPAPAAPRLGIRANLPQFALLVGVNALVGGMLGQERTVVPLLAQTEFHQRAFASGLTFILAFGFVKAATNLVAGTLSDVVGRKPVLVAGWLVGVPVPLMLMWVPSWGWVVAANMLLGLNQGLTWSTTVIMKIDLVGPDRRGLAMGLNEFAGYGAVALTSLATGSIAQHYGLRPAPFFLGLAFAGLGTGLSMLAVHETKQFARADGHDAVPIGDVFLRTTLRDRSLSSACQAGLVNNLNDGLAWGLFPMLFAAHGLPLTSIGLLAALYPGVWSAAQLVTGALSDRLGRKWLIVAGMWLQGAAIWMIAALRGFVPWAAASCLLGVGTALVYPTLLAAIGDVAEPHWRASAVGVYRLWRDTGFAVGAVLVGVTADALGPRGAIRVVAVLTALSGIIVAVRMDETRRVG